MYYGRLCWVTALEGILYGMASLELLLGFRV